jgi:HAD superfamily hydrolase (TIGR01509 family)
MQRRGCEFTAELKNKIMGMQPRMAFSTMIAHCDLDETWQAMAEESNRVFLDFLDGRLATMPGLMELLDALERAGIPKAIGTSSGRELVAACLRPFGLRERFQFVLTAEDIAHGKPDPEIYLTAAKRLGAPPAEVLVLEDSENGCLAAAAAGTFVVAVPGDHSKHQNFSMASLVVESLADPRLYLALGIA